MHSIRYSFSLPLSSGSFTGIIDCTLLMDLEDPSLGLVLVKLIPAPIRQILITLYSSHVDGFYGFPHQILNSSPSILVLSLTRAFDLIFFIVFKCFWLRSYRTLVHLSLKAIQQTALTRSWSFLPY